MIEALKSLLAPMVARALAAKSVAAAGVLMLCVVCSSGCAVSREQQLRKRGESVRAGLIKERNRVAALPSTEPERSPRLAHLEGLHTTLSAANVGVGAVGMFSSQAQRDLAYDVIEEVYATIEWNTPLGPADAKRALPAGFAGNRFMLDSASGSSPARAPGSQPGVMTSPPLVR
jgi:hypothetical protein